MQDLKKTIIVSSIATADYALRKVIQVFGGEKIIAIHTQIPSIDDEQMKLMITRNVARVRELLDVEELEVDLYDFYGNVRKFNHLLDSFPGYRIVCDITGGDKCVSDALLYACLLARRNDVVIVYVRRVEHSSRSEAAIIQFPPLLCLTDRQREFMERLGKGKLIGEMADALSTSRSNTWNIANALCDLGLTRIEKGTERIVPAYPGNIYSKET
nr:hypothetical protein [Candidatus Sigynarchaeum springense]